MAFSFALTNPGLEKLLIHEVLTRFPGWRLAYSSAGFVTFKGDPEKGWPAPVLARLWGECLGRATESLPGTDLLDLGAAGSWAVLVHTPAPWWEDKLQLSRIELPPGAPSRAWLKIEEAIVLFGLPFGTGKKVIELGAAPGGAAWALLQRGAHVVGVDPGAMHPSCLNHPRFTHLRCPFQELTPRDYQDIDWWLSDLNLAPGSVLSHLGRLLREGQSPAGLVLTLKIGTPLVALELREHEKRVADWGFQTTLRLLPSHHREVALIGHRR